ncbi:MAG: bifunctional phosphoribosyl-AMP cyclohydrolase/phosphoribosyl-ATP diphosphatase HisIE [Eubacteriales bacterium]|nr:bifunctional phosphoribosyl-AMP cyclohydrolase/phosphoribosyl-ATP diphosphatase HisIE [Eubacteriales bacterium]MDD3199403.1 bifunctional phosphoribosyl-AMP cyclohydrolase/phosphoribosyl-ATP diphosphatase HisIE [Eubacteriales bacterium]MDD4122081.1 bifunctional phosphoribosyl-AMP cyclohydrolase/phosphoribosyl-ATP diphosphatase HisIE [Eubacteriales bacterium]MDD4629929.1 bifunctional phosphoribosyl-AMP cyclohydrolase/phosphoribosyl-ATP diphosphatase HisIE [Eubacteriales bacterium]
MDLEKYFAKSSLIPAIIQDNDTKKVLMLAYMNEESLKKTIETGYTWFYSRSRSELWNKGATSGHVQRVISITGDCDDDTLLILVEQTGPACHTGNESCFYKEAGIADFRTKGKMKESPECGDSEQISGDEALRELYKVVLERQKTFSENSYTCYLFEKGLDKILKKCGEECSEVIIAAKNAAALDGEMRYEAQMETKNEICDLLYHLTVLMVNEGIELDEINEILKQRSRKIGNLKTFHKSNHNS